MYTLVIYQDDHVPRTEQCRNSFAILTKWFDNSKLSNYDADILADNADDALQLLDDFISHISNFAAKYASGHDWTAFNNEAKANFERIQKRSGKWRKAKVIQPFQGR